MDSSSTMQHRVSGTQSNNSRQEAECRERQNEQDTATYFDERIQIPDADSVCSDLISKVIFHF